MKHTARLRDKRAGFYFTIPLLIFLALMVIYPVYYTIKLSFYEWSLSTARDMQWVGLENYQYAFEKGKFVDSAVITIIYAVFSVAVEVVFGVALALFLNKRSFRGKNLVKTAFMLPMVATPVAIALTWKMLYDQNYGFINFLLKKFGLVFTAISSPDTALLAVCIIEIWQWTPLVMLLVTAGLTALPTEPFEAARVDGASRMDILTKITLPLLSPTILTAALLRMIDALKTFDVIWTTTQGGPADATLSLNVLVYEEAFSHFRFGRASAYIVLFFILVLIATLIFLCFKRRAEVEY